LTVTSLPALHLPDEPTVRADVWLNAVLDGEDLTAVLRAADGLIPWLWSRWNTLGKVGMSDDDFAGIVVEYRREIWLWLAGERVWNQCCSGLLGRVSRRIVQVDTPGN
jgi:hypothetical protein